MGAGLNKKVRDVIGVINISIKGEAAPVTVKIPVLGSYSKTWPLNCPKSDKIVRQVADYLSKPESTEGLGGIGIHLPLPARPVRNQSGAPGSPAE